MSEFRCKSCGGELEVEQGKHIAKCKYCGSIQTIPVLTSQKNESIYLRASDLRLNNEYDKASALYEELLNDNPHDSDLYWSLVLCRYGITYVDDPKTSKKIPTINRTQNISIYEDEDYKKAILNGNEEDKKIYETEAKKIDVIQKEYLEISSKEEPFDIFICYKESDEEGVRTKDSLVANDLYDELVSQGYKVFFSRVTLEKKLGVAYEPYIFQALNTAKVMIVIGTSKEHFEAVWVKNEWSRYLNLINKDKSKVLIPAYLEMDAKDLPSEFLHLQAQDMSAIDFTQELIRGINKLVNVNDNNSGTTEGLLKRANLLIEDGDFANASLLLDKSLNFDLTNGDVYESLLLIENKVKSLEELTKLDYPLDDNLYYKRIMRFGSDELKERLTNVNKKITDKYNQSEEAKLIRKKRHKRILAFLAIIFIGVCAVSTVLFIESKNDPIKIVEKINLNQVKVGHLSGSYTDKAIINVAKYYLDNEDKETAIKALEEIVDDSNTARDLRDGALNLLVQDKVDAKKFNDARRLLINIVKPTLLDTEKIGKEIDLDEANYLVVSKEYEKAIKIYQKYKMDEDIERVTNLLLLNDEQALYSKLSEQSYAFVRDIYDRSKDNKKQLSKYNRVIDNYIDDYLKKVSSNNIKELNNLIYTIDGLNQYDLNDGKYKLEKAYLEVGTDQAYKDKYIRDLKVAGVDGYKSSNHRTKFLDNDFEISINHTRDIFDGDGAGGPKDIGGAKFIDLSKPFYANVILNGKHAIEQTESIYISLNNPVTGRQVLRVNLGFKQYKNAPVLESEVFRRNINQNAYDIMPNKGELDLEVQYTYRENGNRKTIYKDLYTIKYVKQGVKNN